MKQLVGIRLLLDIAEYCADVYYNAKMGERIHAAFPAGVVDDVNYDGTNAKVNGNSAYVFICATPDGQAMYFAREKKGHEGVKGTVVEEYMISHI